MIDKTCCCGISLRRGVRAIGIFDIVIAFGSVFCLIFSDKLTEWVNGLLEEDKPVAPVSNNNDTDDISVNKLYEIFEDNKGDGGGTETMIIISVVMIYTTLDIVASSILLHGTSTKNKTALRWWTRLRLFLLGAFVIYFFVEMKRSSLFLYGVIDILIIFYRMYCLSTVNTFIRHLEREEELAARRRRSIVIPYVQVITPEGSYSALFPCVGDNNFQQFNGDGIPGILQHDESPYASAQRLLSD